MTHQLTGNLMFYCKLMEKVTREVRKILNEKTHCITTLMTVFANALE